jgi:tricorn protease
VPALAVIALAATGAAAVAPHGGMLRYPDVSRTHITFLYANDLWLVPKEGGTAVPLASPDGVEAFPRFSPDGATIAFMGNYDGDMDLYTIPVEGGVPFRVTHHPANELLNGWIGDARLFFSAWGFGDNPQVSALWAVSSHGGMPERLPVPYGAVGAVSPDGRWLAYTPYSRDFHTWKRYRGGMATDIWLFHLQEHTSKKITDWEGTDTDPMWQGERVYYLSDAGPNHRLNIWVYDLPTGERRQVTRHEDYDVKWPSIGPGTGGEGEIVYQLGSDLRLLDLVTEDSRSVSVAIPGDRPTIRERTADVSGLIEERNLSPTGKRVVLEARGDIWSLPAKNGTPINLTRTSGAGERDPAWSPDRKWIAYFSDETGEYELYITGSDGREGPRKLTDLRLGYLFDPQWSPDSKWISFWDQSGTLHLLDVDGRTTRTIDRVRNQGLTRLGWSPDSRWFTYTKSEHLNTPLATWLYDVKNDAKHPLTRGIFTDTWPTFDREGKYLYFASQRDFTTPEYADYGTTWVYVETDRLYVVPLKSDAKSPIAPEIDAEDWDSEAEDEEKDDNDQSESEDDEDGKAGAGKKDEKDGEGDDGDADEKKIEPVEIDLDGFERRAIQLPVESGGFLWLEVNDEGDLVYARIPEGSNDGTVTIQILDLEEDDRDKMEKVVVSGVNRFYMSADGKKLLVTQNDGSMAIIDARAEQTIENRVSTAGMNATIDPRKEWRQIFADAWRGLRDRFYDPGMHGVDWAAVRRQYESMLEDCVSRSDVGYVLGEMIAELNVGHTYYGGGDLEGGPAVSVGMLGCDFELKDGGYRIARILEGAPWDADARGPLSQPGVDVSEGDYLLAVNGVPIDTAMDPWAAFQGLAEKKVTLTVGDGPVLDDKARRIVVELLASDDDLRYRAWVEKNRATVAEKTDGRVGYIYVPDTGLFGQNELNRQFYGQIRREALIIDERWNGGGQIPTRFIELLNRPVLNYWAQRYEEEDGAWPPDSHQGPKCMLINGLAGSGGDYFPWAFRKAGLGQLIGTRTWGGLVGIGANQRLIDGGVVTIPTFAFYETDGTWGIEGHGVDPDIEVIDDPALMADGGDPQLDAAIEFILGELERSAHRPPHRPAYADRSGMGIREQDK